MGKYPPDSFGMELLNQQPIGLEMGRTKMATDARSRYGGIMPTTGNTGCHSNEESEQISQWSNWLKGTAPAPVF